MKDKLIRDWWVYARARKTNHDSKWGPFSDIVEAATWLKENRPVEDWKNVMITGITRKWEV